MSIKEKKERKGDSHQGTIEWNRNWKVAKCEEKKRDKKEERDKEKKTKVKARDKEKEKERFVFKNRINGYLKFASVSCLSLRPPRVCPLAVNRHQKGFCNNLPRVKRIVGRSRRKETKWKSGTSTENKQQKRNLKESLEN